MRPTAMTYGVVSFLASICANLAVLHVVAGTWLYYFVFGHVLLLLSGALAALFTAILVVTRLFTGPQLALWAPAVLGVLTSLVLVLGVLAPTSTSGDFMTERSWMTISYLALPPLAAALWFEAWETVRLREARSAAPPDAGGTTG